MQAADDRESLLGGITAVINPCGQENLWYGLDNCRGSKYKASVNQRTKKNPTNQTALSYLIYFILDICNSKVLRKHTLIFFCKLQHTTKKPNRTPEE